MRAKPHIRFWCNAWTCSTGGAFYVGICPEDAWEYWYSDMTVAKATARIANREATPEDRMLVAGLHPIQHCNP